jgi:hypothetical protein
MLSAKSKVILSVFGILAIVIFIMYFVDTTSKKVERFSEDDDNEDIDEVEMETETKETMSKNDEVVDSIEKEVTKEVSPKTITKNNVFKCAESSDKVSCITQYISSLSLPEALKISALKELFSEENLGALSDLASTSNAKKLVNDVLDRILQKKNEEFNTQTTSTSHLSMLTEKVNKIREHLEMIEDELDNMLPESLVDNEIEKETPTKPMQPRQPMQPTPKVNTTTTSMKPDAKSTVTTAVTTSSNDVIEGFENYRSNYAPL